MQHTNHRHLIHVPQFSIKYQSEIVPTLIIIWTLKLVNCIGLGIWLLTETLPAGLDFRRDVAELSLKLHLGLFHQLTVLRHNLCLGLSCLHLDRVGDL